MDPIFDSATVSVDGERRNRYDYCRLGSRIWKLSGVVSSRFRVRGHKVEIFISVLSPKDRGGKRDKCHQDCTKIECEHEHTDRSKYNPCTIVSP